MIPVTSALHPDIWSRRASHNVYSFTKKILYFHKSRNPQGRQKERMRAAQQHAGLLGI